ncbi:alpha/beta hydrolase [Hoyosella altamirensis]|uniref:S-formylglutathione hydrolase FrmB n=1 Tax=Hoyosella altamirensis TaxID=616997 RepID=A0A839RMA2_9ACTN|nr:alpha/beta hydrolase family protein [Hoyosella altamirensis]MBB3037206.1 S-formylglutathione hydrolase FrmB [Hoyosella altamirensis]
MGKAQNAGGSGRRTPALRILVALAALLIPLVSAAPASAQPGPRVDRIDRIGDRFAIVHVYSPSMNRVIPNEVYLPANQGAASPTLYLLNGVDGGQEGKSWFQSTRLRDFFSNKHVKVVSPIGGRYSMYADWRHPDPVLGVNKWQTYMTSELPIAIDNAFPSTGRNAVGGLSLSAASALDLAVQAPNRYQAVASYSGCARTSAPEGVAANAAVVAFGGGNVFNAFGPPGDPSWVQHDPFVNAERLRGKAIYLAAASGIPGPADGVTGLAVIGQTLGPGAVEFATNLCSMAFKSRLDSLGIPATLSQQATGAHTWGLFEQQMRDSWRVIGPAIGA